jgi:hypothetical protein
VNLQTCKSVCPQHLSPCELDHNRKNEKYHKHVTLGGNLCFWGRAPENS